MEMHTKPHLLVVDDDARLRQLLTRYLTENGFEVTEAAHAGEARTLLKTLVFDALILDVMMPGESGLELATRLIEEGFETPILLLTAMGEAEDRIHGLEKGVDDYMAKPFEPRELLLRLRAIMRRSHAVAPTNTPEVRIGHYVFDTVKGQLFRGGEIIALTPAESNLLKSLVAAPGETLTREMLAEKSGLQASPRTIDVQITRLRRKLEDDPKAPKYLQTVRNAGYVLWLQ